ncbi:hypothetical protein M5D96_007593, partial [Drosophila gunungcola]
NESEISSSSRLPKGKINGQETTSLVLNYTFYLLMTCVNGFLIKMYVKTFNSQNDENLGTIPYRNNPIAISGWPCFAEIYRVLRFQRKYKIKATTSRGKINKDLFLDLR